MGNQQQTLARRIAFELIGELELWSWGWGIRARYADEEDERKLSPYLAQKLFEDHHEVVNRRIRRMRAGTLGVIAASGRGRELYYVHCGTWLGKYDDGKTLLRDIATTAIIAQMADELRHRHEGHSPKVA